MSRPIDHRARGSRRVGGRRTLLAGLCASLALGALLAGTADAAGDASR